MYVVIRPPGCKGAKRLCAVLGRCAVAVRILLLVGFTVDDRLARNEELIVLVRQVWVFHPFHITCFLETPRVDEYDDTISI